MSLYLIFCYLEKIFTEIEVLDNSVAQLLRSYRTSLIQFVKVFAGVFSEIKYFVVSIVEP